ncbi:MAG: tetratricopeptide repeat protein [Ignavibacteria bacterium]|nr:tetratricopeptide repeat protein [Ignavibacteria bacterium]MBT8381564.1 tetratricopeptide repeat protein [Ignavibacteria bacterium]MBT8391892.1 tetratricopeptide repeat protein [Ignavibacteria bacterium]NNJ53300.1 tetratricopeptide repeat protein [Ignavibacteriaceae bacterium]NNL22238.1 tetratricopeptide repeat protein [Ignavibacteriaceae bacterium]
MKTIFNLLILSLLLALLAGCTGSKVTTDEISEVEQIADPEKRKQKAFEYFLNGSIAQNNNDFATAIQEFNKALNYDTSAGIYFALAKNYLSINKLAAARNFASLAVGLDSTEIEYLDLLANVFIQARENDSAIVVLEKIIEVDPSNLNTYYKLGRIYEDAKPLKAIEVYEKLTEIIGPEWNVLIRVADLYEKLGYKKEAEQSLRNLLNIDPSNIALQKMIIDFHLRNENYESAIAMLDEILELTPNDLDARERKAQIFIQQNNWEDAATEYKYILEQPDVPLDVKISIGATYFNKSFSDSTAIPIAKELFQSIDADTSHWRVKLYLGAIATSERDDSTAIEQFKFVTENAKYNSDAWIQLGGLYFDNQKYEESEKIMNEAIELFPNEFAVNLILGLSLAQQGKSEEGKVYLKKATELNPNDLNALSAYSFALGQLNENEEAVKYLKMALKIDPNNVNLLGQLGLTYNNLEMMAESDSIYERALELDSANALVNNNYAYSLSERDLQLDRALKMIEIAMNADSSNSSYLDTYGWIFFKLGEYDNAYYYIKKAIDIDGEDNAILLEHLGDVLFKQEKKDEALKYWNNAFKLDESNEVLKQKIETGII